MTPLSNSKRENWGHTHNNKQHVTGNFLPSQHANVSLSLHLLRLAKKGFFSRFRMDKKKGKLSEQVLASRRRRIKKGRTSASIRKREKEWSDYCHHLSCWNVVVFQKSKPQRYLPASKVPYGWRRRNGKRSGSSIFHEKEEKNDVNLLQKPKM